MDIVESQGLDSKAGSSYAGKRNFGWKYFFVISVLNLFASIILMMLEFIYHRSDLEIGVFFLPIASAFYFFLIEVISLSIVAILYFSRLKYHLIFFPAAISIIVFLLLISPSSNIYREFLPSLFVSSSLLFLVYYLFDLYSLSQISKIVYWELILSLVISALFIILIFVPNNFLGIKTTARPALSIKKVVPANQFSSYDLEYSGSDMSAYWISIRNKQGSSNPVDEVNDYRRIRIQDQKTAVFPKGSTEIRINGRNARILCNSYHDCSIFFIVANNYFFEINASTAGGVFKTEDGMPISRSVDTQKEVKSRLTNEAISAAKTIEQNSRYLEVGF